MKLFPVVVVGVLLLLLLFSFFWVEKTSDDITTFDECAKLYPVLESYPRQCHTPDGRHFVEEVVSEVCRYTSDCAQGYFCRSGLCTELVPEHECITDDDCVLMDTRLGLGCCYAGACAIIDYSEDQWIAVNTGWLQSQQQQFCPSKEDCGPAPGCPVQVKNDSYKAHCATIYCITTPCPPGLCDKRPV